MKLSRKTGETLYPSFSEREGALLERCAQKVMRGEFPNTLQAAHAFMAERAGLARRYPDDPSLPLPRSLRGVHQKLWLRCRELGRPMVHARLTKEDEAAIERYARQVIVGRFRLPAAAAKAYLREVEKKQRGRLQVPSVAAIRRKMRARIHALGGTWRGTRWRAEELRIVDRFAQGLVQGRYPHAMRASRACWSELERRHQQRESRKPPAQRMPQPRTLLAVQVQLRERSFQLGRPKQRLTWLPAERQIARKWAKCYMTKRLARERYTIRDAGKSLSDDLARHGFVRTPMRCVGQLAHWIWRKKLLATAELA